MSIGSSLNIDKIKRMLNRPDSVNELNNKEMNDIIQKQHKLNILVNNLRQNVLMDFENMKEILNENPKKYSNNSYLMNLKLNYLPDQKNALVVMPVGIKQKKLFKMQ